MKRVNVAVGLDRSEVMTHIVRRQQQQIDALREQVEALLRREPAGL